MIEGHTDDLPIHTAQFPSNWELSTARATSAMRFMVGAGIEPVRVGVAGYADLRPLQPNDSDEHRARNRRVEFVFLRAER
ncbi:MAG: OmpA family protein [Vicinamibacterales bacterium]